MKTKAILPFIVAIAFAATLEARVWRPQGRSTIKGDFEDVKGSDVVIKTETGTETVPYADLSTTDKAVVRAQLQSRGRTDEATRLDQPAGTETSEGTGTTSGVGTVRIWTDVNGEKLEAEFLAVVGETVMLKANGMVGSYPLSTFSAADQQWITAHDPLKGARPPAVGGAYGPPGLPAPATSAPGYPGAGGYRPGFQPPNYPGSASSAGSSAGYPGSVPRPPTDSPGFPTAPSTQQRPGYPGGGSGSSAFGPPAYQPPASSAPTMPTPGFQEPAIPEHHFPEPAFSQPQVPAYQPPTFQPPVYSGPEYEEVFQCDNCGKEFGKESGLKIGDECPNCSGGFGSFRLGRGAIKGIVFLVCLVISGVGWAIKKISAG